MQRLLPCLLGLSLLISACSLFNQPKKKGWVRVSTEKSKSWKTLSGKNWPPSNQSSQLLALPDANTSPKIRPKDHKELSPHPFPALEKRSPEVANAILELLRKRHGDSKLQLNQISSQDLASIEVLNLNQLEFSPRAGDFSGLTQLEQLYLARNKLQKLDPMLLYNLPRLHLLDLHGNQFEKVDLLLENFVRLFKGLPRAGFELNLDDNPLASSDIPKLLDFATEHQFSLLAVHQALYQNLDGFTEREFFTKSHLAKVKYLPNNAKAWQTRWSLIDRAKQRIDMSAYQLSPDVFGFSFLGLLLKKAKEGVHIRLLIDARGSSDLLFSEIGSKLLGHLNDHPNIEIKMYNSSLKTSPQKSFSQLHDKLLVIDKRLTLVGSRNISMAHMLHPEDFSKAVLNEEILMASFPLATQALTAFELEYRSSIAKLISRTPWHKSNEYFLIGNYLAMQTRLEQPILNYQTTQDWRHLINYGQLQQLKNWKHLSTGKQLEYFNPLQHMQTVRGLSLDSNSRLHPTRKDPITQTLQQLIKRAQKRIVLFNAHLLPSGHLAQLLGEAAHRGVQITFITNATQSPYTKILKNNWQRLLRNLPASRIYISQSDSKIQMRSILIDENYSLIGSYTPNYLSTELNSEFAFLIHSPEFQQELQSLVTQFTLSQTRVLEDRNPAGSRPDEWLKWSELALFDELWQKKFQELAQLIQSE